MSAWREMAVEMHVLELLEAEDRIRDLQGERDVYRDMAQLSLATVHVLTRRLRRERRRRIRAERGAK